MLHAVPLFRPRVERLEERENPAGILSTEGFDFLTLPKLPTGWATWSNDGQPQFMTTKLTSTTTPNSLASLGSRTVAARAWNSTAFGSDYGVSLNVRSDTPAPIDVIARGSNLNTAKPSYLAAIIRTGGVIELVEVNAGVSRSLGIVKPTQLVTNASWLKITLQPAGSTAGVQVQRLDTNQYLGANGVWQTAATQAISKTVTLKPATGLLGIGRDPGASGMAYVDDFTILLPPGINESFDTTAANTIPTGWVSWANDNLNRARVGNTRAHSGTQALAIDGASPTLARAWASTAMDANVQASVSVYADNLIPSGIVVRGSNLNTTTPTYYSLTLVRGLTVQLKSVVNGVETVLGSITSKAYTSGTWIRLTLVADGDKLKAVVYRPDTGKWLTTAGVWSDVPESLFEVTNTAIRTGGFVGVERGKVASGTVWFDDFEVKAPTVNSGPSVGILASQSTQPVSKVVTFTAAATSSIAVRSLEFKLDGITRSVQNLSTASWELDTTTLTNGTHVLDVRAIDANGNSTTATYSFNAQNGVQVNIFSRVDTVHHYSHIRVAMLAYSGNPAGAFEQNLAKNSVDLIVPNTNLLNAFETAAPDTTKVIYTNVSNLYAELLTDWGAYADANALSRELAYYHVSKATAFTGNSPSSTPVNWFWSVMLANTTGPGTVTDYTSAARGTRDLAIKVGTVGQSLSIAFPEKFREMNVTVSKAAVAGWAGVYEYVSAVNADGTPAAWKTLNLLSDGTTGLKSLGQITFDPPADWVAAKAPNGSQRVFQIRLRTTAGTAAQAPELKTIFGRDYVNANRTTTGTIPAFDSLADKNKDGYLSDAEYATRRSGFDARFTYESRLFYPYYGQMRFLTNPGTVAIRQWAADYNFRLLTANPKADGLFLDNAHGKLPFDPTTTSVIESTSNFTQDLGSLTEAITRKIYPKWTVSNTAGSNTEANAVAKASTVAVEEFLLRPNDVNWSNVKDVATLVTGRLGSDNPSPYLVLDSLSGSRAANDPRTQMGVLSYYYLLADPNKTFLMLFGGQQPSAAWSTTWIPAIGYNVGKPTGAMTTWASGTDPENTALTYQVLGRTYENAITLFKPRSYTLGKGTGTTNDATATTHSLGGNYRVLNPDGTLGSVITQITLRGGEGVVLIKA